MVCPGRIGLLAAFLALAVASPAEAQEDAEYEEVAAKARSAFEGGRFEEAADHFKQAFDIDPRGTLLYNIGLCYEKSGDAMQAVTFYTRYIQAVPGSPQRPAVQRKIADLQAQLGDQYEDVSVNSDPPGAVIFVDDKAKGAMGAAPLTFKLLPGTYIIIAELKDYEPSRKKVEIVPGAPAMVDFSLVDSASVGTLDLRVSERDAGVMVDGRKVGDSPLEEALRLRRGRHEIIIMKPGYTTWRREVDLRPGDTQNLQADLVPEGGDDVSGGGGGGGGNRLWAYVTLGAGVALIGGGVLMGVGAQSFHDQLSSEKADGKRVTQSQVDDGNFKVLMTNVLIGAGSAAVVGGAVWWWLAGRGGGVQTSGDVQAGAAPMPGGGAAFQIGGRF